MLYKKVIFLLLLLHGVLGFSQNWLLDFEKAKAMAAEGNKPIILVFQGSDWCGPCIKLDKEVWSTEEFKIYAETKFIMLKADFPKRKVNALSPEQQEHNDKLAEKYNLNGYFPFVVVLDKTGKVLGTAGYEGKSPKEYIALLESFKS